jgi:hypothetical protein
MSMHAHERIAELELALKQAQADLQDIPALAGMAGPALEYCLAYADFRRESGSVSDTNLGTEVWAAYNARLRAIQGRMDAAWAGFEREAAKRAPKKPPPSNAQGPELFSPKPKRRKS